MLSRNEKKRLLNDENKRGNDRYYRKKHHDDRKNEKRIFSRSAVRSEDQEIHKIFDDAKNSLSRNSSSESRHEDSNEVFQYFSKYKHELNKIFTANPNLVHDIADFWKFVEKYESVKKQLNDSDESEINSGLNSIGLPEKYYQSYCLNFKLNLSYGELFARVLETKSLIELQLLKFRNVILLYLDFKQKEKFTKLKKLRNTQANLPVARYKEKIVEMIKTEKVIVIAGDTGCGKSTQIPRYLYEAGFQKIGNVLFVSLSKYFISFYY